uniref:InlB B-repeat-containing protein n=1 Tax=Candidatus Methanomassiliicoccus intestinalis TaxID=1406512 RepID=UPI0037DD1459
MSDESSASNTINIEFLNNQVYCVFANGHSITISADGESTKITSTDRGVTFSNPSTGKGITLSESNTIATFTSEISKKLVVFGGSKNGSVDKSNITMDGGEVYYLVGGGYFDLNKDSTGKYTSSGNAEPAKVSSSTIIVNGGTANSVFGGGMGYATVGTAKVTINGCTEIIDVDGGGYNGHLLAWNSNGYSNVEYGINSDASNLKDKFYNVTDNTTVTINDGKIYYAMGGGRLGCTYVGTTSLTINSGTFYEIIAGGTNGYTGTANLTIEASSGKSITAGLISSGNRGQVHDVTVNIQSLGEDGKTDLVSIGALSGLTATDGGPNAIFDKINFTIAEGVTATNIYLGGAKWSNNGTTNPWDKTRGDSLSATDITINAGGHTITAADIPKDAKSSDGTYAGYADSATATNYTIESEHTWTLTNGTLELITGSSITNNGTFTNDGTIVVNEYDQLISAAAIGGKIKLGDNISYETNTNPVTDPVVFTSKAELDLNSKTLTISGNARIEVKSSGDLTITDSSSGTNGTITYTVLVDEHSAIMVKGDNTGLAKLTLDKCNIVVDTTNNLNGYGIFASDYSNVVCGSKSDLSNESVSIRSGYSAISGNGINSKADITIYSGKYESTICAAVYFPSTEKLTVTGGEFTGKTGFDIRAGTVNISGAKITANGNISNKFPAADGPSGWGMGIAVFDHSSYANGSAINVTIDNVIFDDGTSNNVTSGCTTCNIFVGKHPGDVKGANSLVSFSNIGNGYTPAHTININISKVSFTGKGLYIYGANNVTVDTCKFDEINTRLGTPNLYEVSAIGIENSSGNLVIKDNIITTVKTSISGDDSKKYMGICVTNPRGTSAVDIKDNKITNVNHNAIYVQGSNTTTYTKVNIEGNTITNWDADNDGVGAENVNLVGGRAIRIDVTCNDITISENTFVKTYTDTTFGDNESYDDGNILKASTDAKFTNNVLRLTGIADYSGDKLFKFDDNNTRFLVTFNANGGYFLDDDDNKNLYSLFVASDDGATISQPDSKLINRSGSYEVTGWYTNESLTNEWNFDKDKVTNNTTTLYAKWTYTGGSGGYPVNPPVTPDEPEEPIIPDSSGNAEIKVDDKKADELVHETVASGSNTLSIVDKDNVEGTVTS